MPGVLLSGASLLDPSDCLNSDINMNHSGSSQHKNIERNIFDILEDLHEDSSRDDLIGDDVILASAPVTSAAVKSAVETPGFGAGELTSKRTSSAPSFDNYFYQYEDENNQNPFMTSLEKVSRSRERKQQQQTAGYGDDWDCEEVPTPQPIRENCFYDYSQENEALPNPQPAIGRPVQPSRGGKSPAKSHPGLDFEQWDGKGDFVQSRQPFAQSNPPNIGSYQPVQTSSSFQAQQQQQQQLRTAASFAFPAPPVLPSNSNSYLSGCQEGKKNGPHTPDNPLQNEALPPSPLFTDNNTPDSIRKLLEDGRQGDGVINYLLSAGKPRSPHGGGKDNVPAYNKGREQLVGDIPEYFTGDVTAYNSSKVRPLNSKQQPGFKSDAKDSNILVDYMAGGDNGQ